MFSRRRVLNRLFCFVLGLAIALGIAACEWNNLRMPSLPGRLDIAESFPTVEPLPDPELPEWIEQISPQGQADSLAQIRIRFESALIPVESLESTEQRDILEKFELTPALPGQFRFLTPRMVGFQADQALPKATRMRVKLKAGLADLAGHELSEDLAWTFNTEEIGITNLPGLEGHSGTEANPLELTPTLEVMSNVELDIDSLKRHVNFSPAESDRRLALEVALVEDESPDSPATQFNPDKTWLYALTPQRSLDKASTYTLEFEPGIKPVRGNLPSDESFESEVVTYAPLAFEGIEQIGAGGAGGAYGRFENGLPQLRFNNGLVAETAVEHVSISPPAKAEPQLVRAYDGDRLISLNPWALEPATQYTLTLGADLADQFGQTLGEPVTVEYATADLAADLWAPSDLHIFPASQDLQLNVSTVNLPQSSYRAAFQTVQPTDLIFAESAYPRDEGRDLLPPPETWDTVAVEAAKNEITETAIPLRERLGGTTGLLAYGVQARTTAYEEDGQQQWREPSFYGLVQLTNLGAFAQWFPEAGLIRVHHLSDGAVVPSAQVEVYRSQLEGSSGSTQPCAVGQTDENGTLRLENVSLQACHAGTDSFTEPPELLVVAREGTDWAFVRSQPYSGSYGYGLYADWESQEPRSRGTIFSDRQLYQPGETAWLTGAAYYLQDGALKQDKNVAYTVTLQDPNGSKFDLGTQTTNEFGTFSLEWKLGPDQPLGYYSVSAKADSGAEILGEFRVAEFKPPNFKVDLTLAAETATAGETIAAQVQSNYLFGPPVQEGQIEYYVTRRPADFTPAGWQGFSFGRRWDWPEEEPTVPSDVRQESQVLSSEGSSDLTVSVSEDLPYAMTYRVDAEVVDASNLSVTNSQTFTALPSDRLIGLKTDFVAQAEDPLEVSVVVSDPQGNAIGGESVRLELQKVTYSSVVQVVEGSRLSQNQVEYETVATASVRSRSAPRTVTLTPPESGTYRLRANFTNSQDERTATDARFWATGAEPVYWGGRYRNNRLELQLDQESYQPGETATVLIQSPYEQAELYFSVIRHDTLYQQIVPVTGSAPQIQFTVTPDMLPNAAVEAVLVRQGEPLEAIEPNSLDSLVSIGFTPFNTSLENQYLTAEITAQADTLQPAAEQTLQLSLQDSQNRPVRGQFTVMVVNEAVLQLSGYRPPDLVETVYAEQPISMRFVDNRPDVVLVPFASPIAKGWGYGGGLSGGAANTRLRRQFRPLAYYNGSVITNEQGQAEVTFALPDDLTTWRVMVVATDGDLRFGNAETTFVTTQPLVTNPVLPQFVRVGDRFQAGLAATNNTDSAERLTLAGDLSPGLAFVSGDGTRQTRLDQETAAYRFEMVAQQPGTAEVQFRSQLGDVGDAFEVTFPVEPLAVTEQVVKTGVTKDSVTMPLRIAEDVIPDTGGLDVTLASTLIANLQAPAKSVFETTWPNLETAASRLAIAANLHVLNQQYGQTFAGLDPLAQVTQAIAQIEELQQPDGGFANWPGAARSDAFTTTWAAQAIAQATQAGFEIDANLTNRLKGYLDKLLANPGQYDFCQSDLCKRQLRLEALLALEALGDRRNQFLADLYENREQFDEVDLIRLARYLSQFPDWQPQADALASQIQETVYETGRSATVNLPEQWRWFSSTTTAQAQALQLFITRNASPEILSRFVEGLLALRRQGTWQTPYDNAQALTALVDYAQLQPTPPNFEATVRLDQNTLATEQFTGYEDPTAQIVVPMTELPQGASNLTLQKSGEGSLHYVAAYRYRLAGMPPGQLSGLRVTRTVHPVNQAEVLYELGLRSPDNPLTLEAGQVFDIGLEIISDHPVNHVLITDPLPGGLEPIDTSFQTATPYYQAQQDSWQIGYQTLYRDRVLAYGDHLEAGVYGLHYLVRSVTPGTFLWPGSEVRLQYAPEEFGRAAAAEVRIEE